MEKVLAIVRSIDTNVSARFLATESDGRNESRTQGHNQWPTFLVCNVAERMKHDGRSAQAERLGCGTQRCRESVCCAANPPGGSGPFKAQGTAPEPVGGRTRAADCPRGPGLGRRRRAKRFQLLVRG